MFQRPFLPPSRPNDPRPPRSALRRPVARFPGRFDDAANAVGHDRRDWLFFRHDRDVVHAAPRRGPRRSD
jgi:hypothetical protein